ncbi:ABC transporter substrate-binding protein [Mesorhizobium shangrilense]|uniref:ABC transporter substrate-binding protein n=1 Tax=Mesorhizobium shangrilense TaxID=460060 RepID=A0ABV2DH06_9HYPH
MGIDRRTLLQAAGVTLGAVALGAPALAQSDPKPIRIGMLFPRTGDLALLGEAQANGALIAIDMANDAGGINGRRIEVVRADAPTPNAAVAEATRLISSENIKILVGSYASAIASSVVGVAERSGVIHWEVGAIADSLTQRGFKNVFRTCATAGQTGQLGFDFALNYLFPKLSLTKKTARIALVHEDSEFGSTVAKSLTSRANELGVSFTTYAYTKDTNDLSPVVLKLRDAGTDVLLSVQYINDAVLFWRQARQLDLNVKAHVGLGAGHFENSFPKAVGADADGIFISGPPLDLNPAGLTSEGAALAEQFYSRYQKKHGEKASSVAMLGFAGTIMLTQFVLPNAKDPDDPASVRAAALAVDKPKGSTPAGWGVKFNPPGENGGQNERAFWIIRQWQNGALQTIYPEELASVKPIMVPLPEWASR